MSQRPHRPGKHLHQMLMAALLAAAAFTTAAVAAPSRVLAASPALTYISNSRYTLDPSKSQVHVESVVTVTAPDATDPSTRLYWEGVTVTVPPSTAAFSAAATPSGQPLALKVQAAGTSNVVLAIGFGKRIYAGQTLAFVLRFDMVDHATATDRDLRLTRTLSSFPVFALASPDTTGSAVTVVFPPGYDVTQEEGGLSVSSDPAEGGTVYSGFARETGLFAWFIAETEPQYVTRKMTEGLLHITIEGWADDPAWTSQVVRVISQGYAAMRNAIGLGDLPAQSLLIQETSLRDTAGYNGELDTTQGRMSISYYAEPTVILHELAHLWFNNSFSSDRWINEGFASYYAQLGVLALGGTPRSPQLTDRKIAVGLPLNGWSSSILSGSLEEQYAYAASLRVATLIATAAGPDGLASVWRRIATGNRPYQPADGPTEFAKGPVDWRSLLDYLDETTGKSFDDLWRDWIVTANEAPLLSDRAGAQEAFAEAQAASGDWQLPSEIRAALRSWNFDAARSDLSAVMRIFALRSILPARATEEGTTFYPRPLRMALESSVAAGLQEAEGELSALESLNAARLAQSEEQGAAREVGLAGRAPADDLAAARAAFATGDWRRTIALADEARQIWEGATNAGRNRLYALLGLASSIVLAIGLLIVLTRRRRAANSSRAVQDGTLASVAGVHSPTATLAATRATAHATYGAHRRTGAPPGEAGFLPDAYSTLSGARPLAARRRAGTGDGE